MRQMLATDDLNPNFLGASNPDRALMVKFYSRAVQNNFKTQQQGRPIFDDVDYITIMTPGNSLNIIDTPVRPEHRARFAQEWARYKETKQEASTSGTPLSAWPILTAAQVEELRGVKFYTVEMIANASDEQLQVIGMIGGMNPISFRARARAYLQAAAGNAAAESNASEIATRDQIIEDMKKQISFLMQMQQQQTQRPMTTAIAEQTDDMKTKQQLRKEKKESQAQKMRDYWAKRKAALAAKQSTEGG